jgi:hypothetical protein
LGERTRENLNVASPDCQRSDRLSILEVLGNSPSTAENAELAENFQAKCILGELSGLGSDSPGSDFLEDDERIGWKTDLEATVSGRQIRAEIADILPPVEGGVAVEQLPPGTVG